MINKSNEILYNNRKNLLIDTLNGVKCKKIPIWLMRQAGRYLPEYHQVMKKADNFLQACYTPEIATEITLQPIKRFDLDAAIVFSDILVIADALGCKVEFIKNVGPKIKPISQSQELDKPEVVAERLSPVFKSIRNIREKLQKDKSLIGFAGGPWTIATYIIENSNKNFLSIRKMCYADSSNLKEIIAKITEATTIYLIKQIESGVNVIQIFDSNAGILPEEEFRKWVIEPTKKIVEIIRQRYPKFPIVGFPKGAGVMYKEYSKNTGVSAVSIDYNTPMEWAKNNIDNVIQGNLDPHMLAYSEDMFLLRARKIIDNFKNVPFIFNLGHGVIPETPVENVEKLVKFVKEYEIL